ncbi:hypothetical protein QN277_001035 [Acacia crassicarpa]|uniref:non-specific serine/threonine protein kinase n=1 Tax=Acacia crassicarpa TaxID=499986 RepID=A0AAE1TGM8_9FABA|nr:hypothetical protein QN277_001035 [Acacia crassicarpa]
MASLFTFAFLLSSIALSVLLQIPFYSRAYDYYEACSNLYDCGTIRNVGFPFWGKGRPQRCGYPELFLNCSGNSTFITIQGVRYLVLDAKPDKQVMKIVRFDYMDDLCPDQFINPILDPQVFEYEPELNYLTLAYGCSSGIPFVKVGQFFCSKDGLDDESGFALLDKNPVLSKLCNASIVVPIEVPLSPVDIVDLGKIQGAIRNGFEVKWITGTDECDKCRKSGGVCGYDWAARNNSCYYKHESSASSSVTGYYSEPHPLSEKSKIGLIAGVSAASAAIFFFLIGLWVFFTVRRRKRVAEQSQTKDLFLAPYSRGVTSSTTTSSQSVPSYVTSKPESLQHSFFYGVKVFTYAELEEATKNFDPSVELGDGGFGTVYYGILKDGRAVAVKRLYESNLKRVEQFRNEVEILARLKHKNLVELYGCTSRHSRELLLVYEYIANGTVSDHLHGDRSQSSLLPWRTRLNIAVETAEALAFLHESDVIHRDVKTNNILLDHNFCVKVADFGLSRLFPNDVTHVSTAPQGTPGYVDPEYFQCYKVTNKSDVYSFGVVLIELISSLEAVDITRHRHDINLANLAINRIQNHQVHELVDPLLGFERDDAVKKMTTAVAELAFRCLQQDGEMRPSMDEVLQILRGIQREGYGGHEEVEKKNNMVDEIMLLKDAPPLCSPDSVADNKWVSSSTTSTSS